MSLDSQTDRIHNDTHRHPAPAKSTAENLIVNNPAGSVSDSSANAKRRSTACDNCHQLKVKCIPADPDKPYGTCSRCLKGNKVCIFNMSIRRRKRRKKTDIWESSAGSVPPSTLPTTPASNTGSAGPTVTSDPESDRVAVLEKKIESLMAALNEKNAAVAAATAAATTADPDASRFLADPSRLPALPRPQHPGPTPTPLSMPPPLSPAGYPPHPAPHVLQAPPLLHSMSLPLGPEPRYSAPPGQLPLPTATQRPRYSPRDLVPPFNPMYTQPLSSSRYSLAGPANRSAASPTSTPGSLFPPLADRGLPAHAAMDQGPAGVLRGPGRLGYAARSSPSGTPTGGSAEMSPKPSAGHGGATMPAAVLPSAEPRRHPTQMKTGVDKAKERAKFVRIFHLLSALKSLRLQTLESKLFLDVIGQMNSYQGFFPGGLLNAEEARLRVFKYHTVIYPRHPVVRIRDDYVHDVIAFKAEAPLLFLAVMAVSSICLENQSEEDLKKNVELEGIAFQAIAWNVIIMGNKSIEILQSILLLSFWYNSPELFQQRRSHIINDLCVSMANDLGITTKRFGSGNVNFALLQPGVSSNRTVMQKVGAIGGMGGDLGRSAGSNGTLNGAGRSAGASGVGKEPSEAIPRIRRSTVPDSMKTRLCRRLALCTYYATVTNCILIRKYISVSWDEYLEECCDFLEDINFESTQSFDLNSRLSQPLTLEQLTWLRDYRDDVRIVSFARLNFVLEKAHRVFRMNADVDSADDEFRFFFSQEPSVVQNTVEQLQREIDCVHAFRHQKVNELASFVNLNADEEGRNFFNLFDCDPRQFNSFYYSVQAFIYEPCVYSFVRGHMQRANGVERMDERMERVAGERGGVDRMEDSLEKPRFLLYIQRCSEMCIKALYQFIFMSTEEIAILPIAAASRMIYISGMVLRLRFLMRTVDYFRYAEDGDDEEEAETGECGENGSNGVEIPKHRSDGRSGGSVGSVGSHNSRSSAFSAHMKSVKLEDSSSELNFTPDHLLQDNTALVPLKAVRLVSKMTNLMLETYERFSGGTFMLKVGFITGLFLRTYIKQVEDLNNPGAAAERNPFTDMTFTGHLQEVERETLQLSHQQERGSSGAGEASAENGIPAGAVAQQPVRNVGSEPQGAPAEPPQPQVQPQVVSDPMLTRQAEPDGTFNSTTIQSIENDLNFNFNDWQYTDEFCTDLLFNMEFSDLT